MDSHAARIACCCLDVYLICWHPAQPPPRTPPPAPFTAPSSILHGQPHCPALPSSSSTPPPARATRPPPTSEGRFAIDLLPPGDYSARAVAKACRRKSRPQLHVDVGAATELEFHLTIAGATGEQSPSPALLRWSTPTQRRLHSARRTRHRRSSAQRPPLLRSHAALARRHAGPAQPDLRHQRRSFFRRPSRIPEQLPGRWRRLQQRLLRPGPRPLSRSLPVLERSRAGVPRLLAIPTAPNSDAPAAPSST